MTGVRYEEITTEGVRITTKDGVQTLIPADTVMVLMPPVPNTHLLTSISAKVPEVHSIGCGNGVDTSLIVHAFEQARGRAAGYDRVSPGHGRSSFGDLRPAGVTLAGPGRRWWGGTQPPGSCAVERPPPPGALQPTMLPVVRSHGVA